MGARYYLTHETLTRNLIKRLLKGVGFHLTRKSLCIGAPVAMGLRRHA
jgi:hypothetical protein